MDDRPTTVTVPTELERADAFIDFTVLASTALLASWLVQHGVPWPALVPLLIPLGLWTLTGEGAADIPYIGSVAAGLRAKFGLRRAHEWVLAFGWYFSQAIWPVWNEAIDAKGQASYGFSRTSVRALARSWARAKAFISDRCLLVVRLRVRH